MSKIILILLYVISQHYLVYDGSARRVIEDCQLFNKNFLNKVNENILSSIL